MNDVITSREELFLAKLAGRDVDIKTMTPPVASSLTEKLMLEIADRLDGMGGGSGETYETVAEIEVGEMQFDGSVYMYVFENAETPAFSDGETYYLNSAECHGVASVDDEGTLLLFNTTDTKNLDPTDPSMPSAAISYEKGDAAFASNSDSFANTTITILKKVSAPSGGDEFLVTATADISGGLTGLGLSNFSASVTEMVAAVKEGKLVRIHGNGNNIVYIDLYCGLAYAAGEVNFLAFDGVVVDGSTRTFYGVSVLVYNDGESDDAVADIAIQPPVPHFDATTDDDKILSVGSSGMEWSDEFKKTYEFGFTASISGNQITYTPAEGVTYAAIAAALAKTPHVKAIITLPEEYGVTITADFNFSISSENDVGYAANAVCIIGSNPVAFILSVGENEGQTICTGSMKTLAVASA